MSEDDEQYLSEAEQEHLKKIRAYEALPPSQQWLFHLPLPSDSPAPSTPPAKSPAGHAPPAARKSRKKALNAPDTGLMEDARALFARLADIADPDVLMDTVNALREELTSYSPMRDQPVDCVRWVDANQVAPNTYNPNSVAPPELKLLALSVKADGYTQPIVAYDTGRDDDGAVQYEVVDGAHRRRIGIENEEIRSAVRGRLPITTILPSRTALEDRQVATVRHNRARGLHTVDGMSEIVLFLSTMKGWPDSKIGEELGMDHDEVLKLRQVNSLAAAFADGDFSSAWEPGLAADETPDAGDAFTP